MKQFIVLPLLAMTLAASGCRTAGTQEPDVRPAGSGTYVVNEGGFAGGGNLSFYDPVAGSISNDVVRNADSWLFPNDILIRSGKIFVAVNGSDRIDIIDPDDDSVRSSIVFPPGTGPGYLITSGDRIYCANYDGTVSSIDASVDSILFTSGAVVGFPGGIVGSGGRLFVSDLGGWPDTGISVKVLDAATLGIVGSVHTGGGPARMVLTGGKLYAVASTAAKLWRIDPVTLEIEDSCDTGSIPGDIVTDGANLYLLTGDAVERVPLAPFARDTAALIGRSEGLFHYALGFDASSGHLYVSTILTAGGSGSFSVYSTAGARLGPPIAAGIFPGAFGFYVADPP